MARPLERTTRLEFARRRGIYLLPNLFTTLNLFAGFYAIVQGMNHEYEKAAVAIFIAMVLDSLDGRVARLTRTQSAFGAEYDSLTDMVSFGAAPALVVYEWALRGAGRFGWIAAFVRSLWSGGQSLLSIFSLIVVTPVVAFYLLNDWNRMVSTVDSWIPLHSRETVLTGSLEEYDLAVDVAATNALRQEMKARSTSKAA